VIVEAGGRSTKFTIEGQRFPRSIVKRRPRGRVGGKTRKKMGFIGGRGGVAPRLGWIAFVSFFVLLSLFLFPFAQGMDSHGTLRTHDATPTHVCKRAPADTHKGVREKPPLPRVPTCFRPQAAVITAQSRVVDQENDASERASERRQRCGELPLLPLPSSSSCTKRSPPATCFPACVVLPEATRNVGRDLEVEKDADSRRFSSLRV